MQYHKSSTQIKLDRALSERTLLQTRLLKFRTTADIIHDEMVQTRKDQRQAPWERFAQFECKLVDLESKLGQWEERIVEVEDRLVRLDEYCEELLALEGDEKEKYDCAIGVSILLIFLFAYDGIIMGFPRLNFWMYLVLPHVFLGTAVIVFIWKKGIMHSFPTAYVLGVAGFLALAMVHQQNFLRSQDDWRRYCPISMLGLIEGMSAFLALNSSSRGNVLTIDGGEAASAVERWQVFSDYVKGYWHGLVNLTNHIAAQQP